jgi:hypothetical protein
MARAKAWISRNEPHGPHAFLRFVMLVFVQRLNDGSDEFIFKGGMSNRSSPRFFVQAKPLNFRIWAT